MKIQIEAIMKIGDFISERDEKESLFQPWWITLIPMEDNDSKIQVDGARGGLRIFQKGSEI